MNKPIIGLLPFYIEFYDKLAPQLSTRFQKILETIVAEIETYNVDVIASPICKVREEFANSIAMFEEKAADAIVTFHLAYSPSLESIDSLASTYLPIIVLDTTIEYDFSPQQNSDEIMFNHGIHGVQDMCNLLIRKKKSFHIEAGHWKESNVLQKIAEWGKAAFLARKIRESRVGIIGGHFHGMGDFLVPENILLSTIGIKTIEFKPSEINNLIPENFEELIKVEIAEDTMLCDLEGIKEDVHKETTIACLKIRQWLKNEKLTAFTINFLNFNQDLGFVTVPFMEAGKAIARGIGYAGEGDVLTAALVGSLLSVYPETMFTEMFCPDWKNNTIFLSHMAEISPKLSSGRLKLIEMDFPYTNVDNPVVAVGRYKSGKTAIINLAPSVDNGYSLIIAPGEIIDVAGEDKMETKVHGWFRPNIKIDEFLSDYSRYGGTHHSALVYGDVISEITKFGILMGWDVHIIE